MGDSFRADDHVKATGAYGGGNYRAYDEKTGQSGYVNSSGYFVADKPKQDYFHNDYTNNADDYYYDGSGSESSAPVHSYGGMSSDGNDILADGIASAAVAGATVVAGVAAASFIAASIKNPDDPVAAAKTAAKNSGCTAGILGLIAIMVVSGSFWGLYKLAERPTGHIADIIMIIIETLCLAIIIGLFRIMFGRPFFITMKAPDISKIANGIGSVKHTTIPKGVNITIVILSTFALYYPFFKFYDGLTVGWFDSLPFALITVLVILLIAMSAMSGTIVGLIIVGILKLITGKKQTGI